MGRNQDLEDEMSNPFGLNEAAMLNDPRSKYWPWIVFERDGNMICAHTNKFVNLHESPAGFGHTIKTAVVDLLKNMHMRCGKAMWFGYGGPAGTCGDAAFSSEIHPNSLAMIICGEIARCPKHGGFDINSGAALAIYYRTDDANRTEALDWEVQP